MLVQLLSLSFSSPIVSSIMLSSVWSSHVVGVSEWGPLLQYFIIFAWSVYVFETYLDYRQHRNYSITQKPKLLTYATQEEFTKAQSYGHDKSLFHFVTSLFATVKMTVQFIFGYYPLLWAISGVLLKEWFGFGSEYELTQSLVFYILDAIFETLIGLPLQAFSTFVIEEKHGFNKQTVKLFITDTIKGILLNCTIAPPLIALFIRVIQWGGDDFYLYVSALLFVIQILAVPFYSNVIQPCFNKVEPLPEGTLRTSIEELAKKVEFPLTGLYVIDGSKRSSHSNAYFYGTDTFTIQTHSALAHFTHYIMQKSNFLSPVLKYA
jgi:STE24 endopeptidase